MKGIQRHWTSFDMTCPEVQRRLRSTPYLEEQVRWPLYTDVW